MPDVDGHLPPLEAVTDFKVNALGFFGRAFPAFNEVVDVFLQALRAWENFFSVFYYGGEIFSAKLLEFGVLHPESLDKADIVPKHTYIYIYRLTCCSIT